MASHKRLVQVEARATRWKKRAKAYKQQRDEYRGYCESYQGEAQLNRQEINALGTELQHIKQLIIKGEFHIKEAEYYKNLSENLQVEVKRLTGIIIHDGLER